MADGHEILIRSYSVNSQKLLVHVSYGSPFFFFSVRTANLITSVHYLSEPKYGISILGVY